MMSGMTEILFGLVIMTTIYFLLNEKYLTSAVILSFLPYLRSEGFIFIIIFTLYFLIKRKSKYLPLLLIGTLFYTIVGSFYYKDLLWIINTFPYTRDTTDIYGIGSFFLYFKSYDEIWGKTMTYLILLGLFYYLFTTFKTKSFFTSKLFHDEYILLLFPAFGFFLAHSVMWCTGIGNSIGDVRYMAAIIPITGIIALRGFNLVSTFLNKKTIIKLSVLIIILFFIVISPFKRKDLPTPLKGIDKEYKIACDQIKLKEYSKNHIWSINPILSFYLNKNPFNGKEYTMMWSFNPSLSELQENDIFIWEGHYANDFNLPIDSLLNRNDIKLIDIFYPESDIMTGRHPFHICIFQKEKGDYNNFEIYDHLTMKQYNNLPIIYSQNFEDTTLFNNVTTSDSIPFLSKNAFKVVPEKEYFELYSINLKEFKNKNNIKLYTKTSFYKTTISKEPVYFVIKIIDSKGNNVSYKQIDFNTAVLNSDKWNTSENFINIGRIDDNKSELKVYIWNYGKQTFYIDNFEVKSNLLQ